MRRHTHRHPHRHPHRTLRLLLLLIGALVTLPLAAAAGQERPPAERAELDAAVSRIRRRYAIIERGLPDYVHVRRDLAPGQYSTEGGEVDGWFSDAGVRKIAARHLGETGRLREQLYFWNDTLIFAYQVEEQYERPLSSELADSGGFVRVVRRAEHRYYFADTTLVGYIGARRGRGVQPPPPEVRERAADLRRMAVELRALVGKGEPR
ncbi:MAG TPA: hypothetical protein VKA84_22150 [Gemmatimonadaceae bacterium]|nr:hypothetical protein [Gemmatimonadaceae bacterium]